MRYLNIELYNVAELVSQDELALRDGERALARVPSALRMALNPAARNRALYATGCEVRCNLDGASARITLRCVPSRQAWPTMIPGVADIYQGSFYVTSHWIGAEPTELTLTTPEHIGLLEQLSLERELPFDARLTRVLLPHFSPVSLLSVEGNVSPPRPGQTPGQRVLMYGSSITHGNRALRPGGTYAARVAQIMGVDLIALGFGAGAHCEPEMADYIAGRGDWDWAVFELGINMIGSFTTAAFRERVAYLIERVTQAHPQKWVFCIDLLPWYPCKPYALTPTAERQAEYRDAVREVVSRLALPRLVHFDGRELLPDVSELSADLVHPSPAGMEQVAANLSRLIVKRMRQAG